MVHGGTAAELVDQLDWRLRLLHYGLAYMGTEEGEASLEQLRVDLTLLVLEMRQILKEAGGADLERI